MLLAAMSAGDPGRQGQLVLSTTNTKPAISADTGTSQRWPIINRCVSRELALRLAGHRPAQIALDGVFLRTPNPASPVVLAPGNRADLLIRPKHPGRFRTHCRRLQPRQPGHGRHDGPASDCGAT
jgi:FtsP/CotA-like multicopper oxidase with cupredoxin domain